MPFFIYDHPLLNPEKIFWAEKEVLTFDEVLKISSILTLIFRLIN